MQVIFIYISNYIHTHLFTYTDAHTLTHTSNTTNYPLIPCLNFKTPITPCVSSFVWFIYRIRIATHFGGCGGSSLYWHLHLDFTFDFTLEKLSVISIDCLIDMTKENLSLPLLTVTVTVSYRNCRSYFLRL